MKLCDCKSDCLDIQCWVPHGSVLGPKLFILYIDGIGNVSKLMKLVLFVYDTNMFVTEIIEMISCMLLLLDN